MPKTFLITGATGMVGDYLINAIIYRGDEYIALTSDPIKAKKKLRGYKIIIAYNEIENLSSEKIDAVINLAGSNLGSKRWTKTAKKDFYDSRINTTISLIELFSNMVNKPNVFISASGVDYYGNTGNKAMYEDAPPADSFLGKLVNDWEQAALKANDLGIRTVILRMGFVLARNSDAVYKLLKPVKYFVGGSLGSGKQYVSWIHIDDLINIYLFAADNKKLNGIYNAAAPEPVTNNEFIRHAAKLLGRPAFLGTPPFMIKAIIGEMSTVILDGRRALPDKLIKAGYKFKFSNDVDAWKDIL
ncbi:MAG: TIGR01777 family oxidoreductase [Ignavibacteria bacterium]|nr:TIGR01777 family oxidoreductase [Ignavibacteria bacterium]